MKRIAGEIQARCNAVHSKLLKIFEQNSKRTCERKKYKITIVTLALVLNINKIGKNLKNQEMRFLKISVVSNL